MIKKYFNVFSEEQLNLIWNQLSQPNWTFWHKSRHDTQNFFWYMELGNNDFFRNELFDVIKSNIGENFVIDRIYANGQTFGLNGNFHADTNDENGYTFLYYPMKCWDLEWGGETVIMNPDLLMENANYCAPIPNSGVIFPGTWIHYGRSPTSEYKDIRITIAYKLTKIN